MLTPYYKGELLKYQFNVKELLANIDTLLESIREEKRKLVKSQQYNEAAVLRSWEMNAAQMQKEVSAYILDPHIPTDDSKDGPKKITEL